MSFHCYCNFDFTAMDNSGGRKPCVRAWIHCDVPILICREALRLKSSTPLVIRRVKTRRDHMNFPTRGCDRTNVEVTLPTNQRANLSWSLGAMINIYFKICGAEMFNEEIKFSLWGNNTSVMIGSSVFRNSTIRTCMNQSTIARFTCESFVVNLYGFNVSMEAREEYNSSAIRVYRMSSLVFQMPAFLIKHCTANDLPESLTIEHQQSYPYVYRDLAFAKCKQGGLLLDETHYSEYINVSCGEFAQWEVPNHVCREIVNFKKPQITMISGQPTIFVCKPDDASNAAQMTVGKIISKIKTNVWQSIIPTSLLHDVTVECDEIDNDGDIIRKRKQKLNVLFPPELTTESRNTVYALKMQSKSVIVIEFQANPPATLNEIQVMRNESRVPNYYLLVVGLKHKVVIHFNKVGADDFGKYTLIITSHPPVRSVLVHNFSISHSSIPLNPKQLTTPEVVGIAIAITIILTTLIVTSILFACKKFCSANSKTKKTNDVSVTYEAKDSHNYEEISGNAGIRGRGSEYINTELAISVRSPQDGGSQMYETPIGPTNNPVEVTYRYNN